MTPRVQIKALGFTVYGLKKTPLNVLKESANSVIYYGRIIYTSLADLLRGRESINDLSGPVGIVTAIGQAASYGWEDVAELLVLITINLGVFNLLPFPALDGGKIVFLLIDSNLEYFGLTKDINSPSLILLIRLPWRLQLHAFGK